jgi:hypothetical protein
MVDGDQCQYPRVSRGQVCSGHALMTQIFGSIKDGLRRRFAAAADGLRAQVTSLEASISMADGSLQVSEGVGKLGVRALLTCS